MCKRHSKNCKFVSIQQSCKFWDHCAYKHNSNNAKSENRKYLDKIIALEDFVEFMKAQICDPTEEVENIKS